MTATEPLTEHLLSLGPDLTDDEARDRWRIENDDVAGWALRKLAAAQAERDRIKRTAEAELARIEAWAADADRAVAHDVAFFTARLIEYRRSLEEQNPNLAKTYKLPAGSIARRKGSTSVVVTDEAAFVAWARENRPEALSMKPRVSALSGLPDKGGIILADEETGETVPGVERVVADDRYEVRPATPSAVEDLEPF